MEIARLVVAALLNSLWETALLALMTAAILRFLPNLNATTRYAAWCITLAASLVLAAATAAPCTMVVQNALHRSHVHHAMTYAVAQQAATISTQPAAPAPANTFTVPHPSFSIPDIATPIVMAIWGLAALLLVLRLAVNLLRLEGLKRDALPLPIDYRDQLVQWSRTEKGRREVRLCVTSGIDVPVAVGLFDSMILIPQRLLDELSPAEIDQIMLHELGHLRRADDWTNGLQRLIQALFFFNPAVLFIAQQLDIEREVACDDWVVRETQNIRPYAQCLTKMAEVTAWPHRPLAAPGVFVTRRGLSVRVERLLRNGRNARTSLSFGVAGSVIAAAALVFFLVRTVAPSYAFTQTQQDQTVTVASAAPPPSPAPKPSKPIVTTKILYVERNVVHEVVRNATPLPHPMPRETTLTIKAIHIHRPAQTIKIPAIDVDVKEQHVHVVFPTMPRFSPMPPMAHGKRFTVLPPNFGTELSKEINSSFRAQGMGMDYKGQDLRNHSFRGMRMMVPDFSHANLQNADFSGTVVSGADFSHANLAGANFSGAHLMSCDFSGADLQDARFGGVMLTACDFSDTNVTPQSGAAILRGCRSGCELTGLNAAGTDLRNVRAAGVDLTGANLSGSDLSGSTFNGVDFSNAKLDGTRLDGATFVNCSFDGVNMQRVDFSKARLIKPQP